MSKLFSSFKLRELEFKNRIFVSPMCQYSANDGIAQPWHMVHLGSRAVGGAALVMVEATGVSAEGRISPQDLGIWSDAHAEALAPIARFIKEQGSVPAIQLAHAGRKASTHAPWLGQGAVTTDKGGWEVIAPSSQAFSASYPMPREMTLAEIDSVADAFVAGTKRSLAAGFEVAEIHMAHGYLLHEFLSPLTNQRKDDYGGNLENRVRLPLRIVREVRAVWPQHLPLFVRISATDWVEKGWDLGQSLKLAEMLKAEGVDFIDCSTGGLVPDAVIPAGPGFQTPFAAAIKQQADIAVGAVGLITAPEQAEQIIATGMADAVLLAREFLRDPYWPLHAAHKLGDKIAWPVQYERAKPA